jgi:SAM-dependent methyltransferase
MSNAERAVSFASTAELYELGRPGYPDDLIESLFAEMALHAPRILDLGAGTGKLTRQLVPHGLVTAVEPLDAMRAQLERVVPDATSVAGSAEAIPLADESVDVVFVGQAYHWFDQSVANPEIARVLVDGGHLVALWNDEQRVPWVVELTEIMSRADSARADAVMQPGWWGKMFHNEPWFTVPQVRTGTMIVPTTKRGLLARMESHSYLSVKSVADRQPILAEVAALVADFTDPFDVAYNTEAYWCTKLPRSES